LRREGAATRPSAREYIEADTVPPGVEGIRPRRSFRGFRGRRALSRRANVLASSRQRIFCARGVPASFGYKQNRCRAAAALGSRGIAAAGAARPALGRSSHGGPPSGPFARRGSRRREGWRLLPPLDGEIDHTTRRQSTPHSQKPRGALKSGARAEGAAGDPRGGDSPRPARPLDLFSRRDRRRGKLLKKALLSRCDFAESIAGEAPRDAFPSLAPSLVVRAPGGVRAGIPAPGGKLWIGTRDCDSGHSPERLRLPVHVSARRAREGAIYWSECCLHVFGQRSYDCYRRYPCTLPKALFS
jgi:hypothetical protein